MVKCIIQFDGYPAYNTLFHQNRTLSKSNLTMRKSGKSEIKWKLHNLKNDVFDRFLKQCQKNKYKSNIKAKKHIQKRQGGAII